MATTSRIVSFVSRIELSLDGGKVLPHTLTFGDVDNDGGNELVVATTEGFLYVFRGHSTKPWCKLTRLGQITCVVVGDVTGCGKNHVIILNTEGTCSIYSFLSAGCNPESDASQTPVGAEDVDLSHKAQLIHMQLLQTNAKMMLLGDVDCDGQRELILCHTDRTVAAYRWNKATESFVALQEWKLGQAVGSITLHGTTSEGQCQILASQPGCSYAILHPLWILAEFEQDDEATSGIEYLSSSLSRSQNPAISCQVVGDICKGPDCGNGYFALCTLDGNIKLMEDDEILWSLQVGHQLFAMNKLDILANGKEEVIVCAWNGLTYIVDHDRNVVRYQFEENVQAFCAGQYAVEDGENVVSLVYANFWDKLFLYYDVQLPRLTTTDFLSEAESNFEIKKLLNELGAETEDEKRSMIRYCMYGIHCEPGHSEVMSGEKMELFQRKSADT